MHRYKTNERIRGMYRHELDNRLSSIWSERNMADVHYTMNRIGRFILGGCSNVLSFSVDAVDPATDVVVFVPFIYQFNIKLQTDIDIFLCLADCLRPNTNQKDC